MDKEKLSEADMELILSVETYSTEADYMIENDPVGFSNLVATLLVETAQEIKCSLS